MRSAVEWVARTPGRAFACIFLLAFAVRAVPLAFGMVPTAWLVPEGRGTNATAAALTLVAVMLGCVAFELWWRRGTRAALLSLAIAAVWGWLAPAARPAGPISAPAAS